MEKIIQDYKNGKSLSFLAKEYGISRRKVTKIIKDSGEKIINKHNMLKFNEHYFDTIDNCPEYTFVS